MTTHSDPLPTSAPAAKSPPAITAAQARAFFDWLRQKQPTKRLSQQAVDAANTLLDVMGLAETVRLLALVNGWDTPTDTKPPAKRPAKALRLSDKAQALIARFEGFRAAPYLDSAGVPTIGYGMTYYPGGKKVTLSDPPIEQKTALALKKQLINDDFAFAINALFAEEIAQGALKQAQFDALVSLAYNIGIKALKQSSIYRHIKAGNTKAAADAFLAWNKARIKGRLTVLAGLSTRRAAERALFLS